MGFHEDCLVLDGHVDTPTRLWEDPVDLGNPQERGHVDLPRLRRGGVDAAVFALFVPARLPPEEGWQHAMALHRTTLAHLVPGMALVAGVEELRREVAQGRFAVLLGLENGRPLQVPGSLERCSALGLRYVTLTHWKSHEWCDASTDEPVHGGLSSEGVDLVREMGLRGILPDVSHVSDRAVFHVLEVARGPVLASHSCARALCAHPRNLPDELIREIARRGGLVMANSYPVFVSEEARRADQRRVPEIVPLLEAGEDAYLRDPRKHWRERAELYAAHPVPPVPLAAFADQVIHLIEQAGEEHVGIGSDFDGIPDTLAGFEDVACFPDLTAALLARGVDRAGVRLVLGENFVRVLSQAERLASRG